VRFRHLACALVACVAVIAAGCGSGGNAVGTTGTTSNRKAVGQPTADWVAGYCSDILELFVFYYDSRDSTLEGFLTPVDASRTLSFRTGRFATEMKELGRPSSPHGDRSERTIRDLAAQEKASAARMARGTEGNPPKGTLAARRQLIRDEVNRSMKAITDANDRLGRDDTEVGGALEASGDCKDLKADMRKHYPSTKH